MTIELYNQLQHAYDHFNSELFAGRLPQCILTVQRENDNVHGYFSPARFGSKTDAERRSDEIAMNPIYFINARLENVLSTLVHEMVHLEQHHLGTPGRGRYHNRQWGDWMQRVGLMPSNTGCVGGKQTGDQMTHYIMAGGPFDQSCKVLIDSQFAIDWYDHRVFSGTSHVRLVALQPVNYGQPLELESITQSEQQPAGEALKKTLGGAISLFPGIPLPNKSKVTYKCLVCGAKVWGKPKLSISCNLCDANFEESPS